MLAITGTTALQIAEAHRRLRHDLNTLHHEVSGLHASSSPARLGRACTSVLELLEELVLPLAAVEDEVSDAVRLNRPAGRVPAAVARAEHDVVREIAATLGEVRSVERHDRDRTIGSLYALDDLVPAHVDGEEVELMAALATLDRTQLDGLDLVADGLPQPADRRPPIARFHLPTPHGSRRGDSPTRISRQHCCQPTG